MAEIALALRLRAFNINLSDPLGQDDKGDQCGNYRLRVSVRARECEVGSVKAAWCGADITFLFDCQVIPSDVDRQEVSLVPTHSVSSESEMSKRCSSLQVAWLSLLDP